MSPSSKAITVVASILLFAAVMWIVGSASDSELIIGTATYVYMTCEGFQADLVTDMLPCLSYFLGISVLGMVLATVVRGGFTKGGESRREIGKGFWCSDLRFSNEGYWQTYYGSGLKLDWKFTCPSFTLPCLFGLTSIVMHIVCTVCGQQATRHECV